MEALPESLKRVLDSRRNQIPSDAYFKSILPEFHRRLRTRSIRRVSPVEMVWERFSEMLQMDRFHGVGYLGATCAVILSCFFVFHQPSQTEQTRLLTLDTSATERSGVEYSLTSAGDTDLENKFDQQLDRISMGESKNLQTNFAVSDVPARYVLTNHPVTYDKVAAF